MYISKRRGNYSFEFEATKSSKYGYAINTTLLKSPKWRIGFSCQFKPLWHWHIRAGLQRWDDMGL